jgi:hypothetical protein
MRAPKSDAPSRVSGVKASCKQSVQTKTSAAKCSAITTKTVSRPPHGHRRFAPLHTLAALPHGAAIVCTVSTRAAQQARRKAPATTLSASRAHAIEKARERDRLMAGPYMPAMKATATAAQYRRILQMLRVSNKNTFDFRRVGVMAVATRILELNRKQGYHIATVARVNLYDDQGYMHRGIAVYELVREP